MAKRFIECQVSDEYVLGAGVVVGAAGSHNDVVLRLAFGDMWAGLDIYATFLDARGEKYTVVLLNRTTMLVPGTTMTYDLPVPAEAKRYEGQMALTFTGYTLVATVTETGGTTQSRTVEESATISTTAYFRVLPSKSAVLEDLSLTPTIAQQLQAAMTQHMADVREELEEHEETVEEWMGQFTLPQRGIDYWTPDDVASMENILRTKAANIGGFVPVNAPICDSGDVALNKTTVTVTDVTENVDGSHTVTFNRKEEMFTDGEFTQYHTNESLVPLNSFSKGENGWSGLNFGVENSGEVRCATVCTAQVAGEAHSGSKYIKVWGRYSSLCKSLKLNPYTQYTLSFWLKGPVATAAIDNISVMAKAYDGDVIYENAGGAYWRSTDASKYEELYNGSYESISNAVIQNANIWQECKINFTTESNEYVDIFIYFGDHSWQYFYFDDFSVTEVLGEQFTASYSAGVEVPPEVAVGSVFYIERDNGRAFTRFEYASSYAIKELYKYMEQLNETAFEDLTKEIGYTSSALDGIIALQNSLMGGGSV